MSNFILKHKQFFLTFLFVFTLTLASLAVSSPVNAQSIVVTGVVTDKDGPLPGVNIAVKGSTVGTSTDAQGQYSITVPGSESVLQFSYIGYDADEETVGSRTIINVMLSESATLIDEVVVVGYGVQKRVNVVGAVTTLKGDDIKSVPAVSAAASISGRLPGVTVLQTTGEPGSLSPTLYVRGR